ncbi:MAG: hypothetical protein J6Z42_01765 [Lachnospiraceae bacterium]|nr:hypothetical protein [Lachnospiraceae bacterium]
MTDTAGRFFFENDNEAERLELAVTGLENIISCEADGLSYDYFRTGAGLLLKLAECLKIADRECRVIEGYLSSVSYEESIFSRELACKAFGPETAGLMAAAAAEIAPAERAVRNSDTDGLLIRMELWLLLYGDAAEAPEESKPSVKQDLYFYTSDYFETECCKRAEYLSGFCENMRYPDGSLFDIVRGGDFYGIDRFREEHESDIMLIADGHLGTRYLECLEEALKKHAPGDGALNMYSSWTGVRVRKDNEFIDKLFTEAMVKIENYGNKRR